jgi:hypothetical protein
LSTIIGYGEDALTLWALSQRMPEILLQLGDATASSDAIVFYRPSCGRGGPVGEDGLRSLFGEFDAIIGTALGVYPVEAKWHHSDGVRGGRVTLKENQLLRHDIFGTYVKLWRGATPADKKTWEAFVRYAKPHFETAHVGRQLVFSTISSGNVRYLLERLQPCGDTVRNVLLFVCPVGFVPPRVAPASFKLVVINYAPLAGVEFFDTLISVR